MPSRFIRQLPLVVSLLFTASFGVRKEIVEASAPPDLPPFLYTVAPHYDPLAWIRGGERFTSGAAIFVHDGTGKHVLVPGFAASADPSSSFDGQRVLFAGKRNAQESWQIFEVPIAGGEARRITSGSGDSVRPFYLPEDRMVYAKKTAGRYLIEAMDLTGSNPLQLTYGPSSFFPTQVLRDGRILFEASQPLGAESTAEIYTVYSDGSGVESYRCDHGSSRHSGRQVSSSDIVFSSAHKLARFTSARAQEVPISAPPGDYIGEVAEIRTGDWLLPWRANEKESFQLVLWSQSATSQRPVVTAQDANAVQPELIAERSVPKRHPSGLHDWPNSNLLCLNSYTSKYRFAAASVQSVRVYTRDEAGKVSLLGTAPVERDGSFFVQVPTERPLQIELLDGKGKTLKREAGFFWMRRGEQRVCVGCHAGPETAPENAVPMILLKSTTPADMTGASSQIAAGGH